MTKIRAKQDTYVKYAPVQSSTITDPNHKFVLKKGDELEVTWVLNEGVHYKAELEEKKLGRYNWYFYSGHVDVVLPEPEDVITDDKVWLDVPYFSQLDNANDPHRQCNVTSVAMCLAYYGVKAKDPKVQLEDELDNWLKARGLSRYVHDNLQKIVVAYGHKDRLSYKAYEDEIKKHLASGNPVITAGWFGTGSGHIVVLVGYDDQKGVYYVNDPYGDFTTKYAYGTSGDHIEYSYTLVRQQCAPNGYFWAHFLENGNLDEGLVEKAMPKSTVPRISRNGLHEIKNSEGLRLEAYYDIVGVLTIGYGSTGPHVTPGLVITQEEAEELLRKDLDRFERAVNDATKGKVSINEFDAFVSLAFNIGIGGFLKSSALRYHNLGNKQKAADSILLWNKGVVGGVLQPIQGLTNRREREKEIYLNNVYHV